MLTHPDPQIQALFQDLEEQRDQSLVKAANLRVENAALKAQLAAAGVEVVTLNPSDPVPNLVPPHDGVGGVE